MHNFPSALAAGYRHFREGDFQLAAGRYQQLATEGQKPSTMVIACCDSRSAPELIFSRGPGDLFVIRNIANMVPPYEPDTNLHGTSAAIEYGIKALKVSDVVVLGHAGCGGIQAALYPDAELIQNSAFIGNWMQLLASTTSRLPTDLPDAFRASQLERLAVGQSLLNLRTFPFVHGLERAGNLRLHGTWFDVGTGELWVKDPHSDAFDRLSSDGDVVPGRGKGL